MSTLQAVHRLWLTQLREHCGTHGISCKVLHRPSTCVLVVSLDHMNSCLQPDSSCTSSSMQVHAAAQNRAVMLWTISVSEQTQTGFLMSVINQCTSRDTCRGTSLAPSSCKVPRCLQHHISLRLCRMQQLSHSSLVLGWQHALTSMLSQCLQCSTEQ